MPEFKDHFSDRAGTYATYRPRYPEALASYLASLVAVRGTAWDVGCGSGQMSTRLGDAFDRVIATDASTEQIVRAEQHRRVRYSVGMAEQAPVRSRSIDLVVAAQSAHWFDLPRFYEEARRVLRLGGAIGLVTYGVTEVDDSIRPVVDHFYRDILDPWWPAERKSPESLYRDLAFPFDEIDPPRFTMIADWSVEHTIGYLGSWSAVRAMVKAVGSSALERVASDLREAWGSVSTRRISWPIGLRVGRVTGGGQTS